MITSHKVTHVYFIKGRGNLFTVDPRPPVGLLIRDNEEIKVGDDLVFYQQENYLM